MSLLEMAEAEAARHGCDTILRVRVEYGALAGLLPEALEFCFKALVANTRHKDAALELVRIPLLLRCSFCGAEFGGGEDNLWTPCPQCGEEIAHQVIKGRELLLGHLEACKS